MTVINHKLLKLKKLLFFTSLLLLSCNTNTQSDKNDKSFGQIKNDDKKSEIVEELADSYLAGNFDIARDYFTQDSQHYFNDLVYDVDGIIEGYNFHSVIFDNIKHNDRKIYTGYFADGSIQTFHDFIWSAKSKISGEEYSYPCHCRWEWEGEKITKTNCYVDPTAIFKEFALYQEENK